MKKEHLKILKAAITNLGELNRKFDSLVSECIGEIDKEMENIGGLAETLQGEFDELSEKQQEGDKGVELEETTEKLGEIKTELEELKDELDDEPFGDIISKLEELDSEPK
jgi:glutamine synthetase type III